MKFFEFVHKQCQLVFRRQDCHSTRQQNTCLERTKRFYSIQIVTFAPHKTKRNVPKVKSSVFLSKTAAWYDADSRLFEQLYAIKRIWSLTLRLRNPGKIIINIVEYMLQNTLLLLLSKIYFYHYLGRSNSFVGKKNARERVHSASHFVTFHPRNGVESLCRQLGLRCKVAKDRGLLLQHTTLALTS